MNLIFSSLQQEPKTNKSPNKKNIKQKITNSDNLRNRGQIKSEEHSRRLMLKKYAGLDTERANLKPQHPCALAVLFEKGP